MNETQQTNVKLYEILYYWDPLGYGEGFYETEISDVLQTLHVHDNAEELARKIQSIYEFSSEEVIPLPQCKQKASELLLVKDQSSCSIN
ncbi:DUF1871 family protein [Priestia filamentosa]|uniref:Uncharacterized protein n=1 Tax=Priestia filamentosa TaxID=1402861 RepID=A0A1X7FPN1_9BACI|nr:DUF1871 family protein [Priestia filamentosa]AKO94551.1 hypothetical protein BEH_22155 [Priestia filamentosa]MDT3764851.1 DUF1871 family protein [Priestia filamentosa]OXS66573.1 hypothetical protein B1B01_17850 [Priestia filamentosa]RJS66342.1 DUF1871 domain-containing protein [Priestia filamentosa]WCM15450.1 DUF1871 family protein [Priestia filamentosa]